MKKFILNRLFARLIPARNRNKIRNRYMMQMQALEDRTTPANFVVSSAGDNNGINPNPGDGTNTLRQAIVDANASSETDDIEFSSYFGDPNDLHPIYLEAALPPITGSVNVYGLDQSTCIINGGNSSSTSTAGYRIFDVASSPSSITFTIDQLTMQGGYTTDGTGAAIDFTSSNGTLSVTNSTVQFCRATGGGASIVMGSNKMTLDNVIMQNYSAYNCGGGIIMSSGTLTITNSSISHFTPYSSGGAIQIGVANAIIENSTISDCKTSGSGGAIYINAATLKMNDVEISHCTATYDGGAVHINSGHVAFGQKGTVSIHHCEAQGGHGGGVNLATLSAPEEGPDQMIIWNTTIDDCIAAGASAYGGGINISSGSGNYFMAGSTISNCQASSENTQLSAYTSVPSPSLTNNSYGGGVNIGGGTIALSWQNCLFENCLSTNKYSYAFGGGLAVAGGTTGSFSLGSNRLTDVTFTGCIAQVTAAYIFKPPPGVAEGPEDLLNPDNPGAYGFYAAGGAVYSTATNFTMASNTGECGMVSCVAQPNSSVGLYNGYYTPHKYIDQYLIMGKGGGAFFNLSSAATTGSYKISNTQISDCTATIGEGGGIWTNNTGLELANSTLEGNTANVGGGIYVSGANNSSRALTLDRSTFSSNHAIEFKTLGSSSTTINGKAGAVFVLATDSADESISIKNSTIAQNTVHGQYAGIIIDNFRGTTDILLSTIVQNLTDTTTVGGGGGSGIGLSANTSTSTPVNTTLNITGTVVAGNGSGNGSISTEENFSLTATSNVNLAVNFHHSAMLGVADFTSNPDYPFDDCLSDATSSLNPISDITDLYDTNTLDDNGGPTQTYLPYTGSPLIDFYSVSSTFSFDQRGLIRPATGEWDIGSVEVEGQAVEISTIAINNGAAQRSRITTIDVTFNVAIDPSLFTPLGALALTCISTPTGVVGTTVETGPINVGYGAVGRISVASAGGLVSTITLTFSNANSEDLSAGVEYTSLSDGRLILSSPVFGFSTSDSNSNQEIRRLFGDFNGDGTTDGAVDFPAFGSTYNLSTGQTGFLAAFDFNGDGTIDGVVDYLNFGNRYNMTV